MVLTDLDEAALAVTTVAVTHKASVRCALDVYNKVHSDMKQFILKRVIFEENSWRKLSKIEIPIAARLTVIAGHNGIGKSSILGFIANASGVRTVDGFPEKSYFGTEFRSVFEEQFRLAPADISAGLKERGKILLDYECQEEIVVKQCNIGTTKKANGDVRYRVVPRTKKDGGTAISLGVKEDGKIPMPTLFVTAARLWPIGESAKVEVCKSTLDPADVEFMIRFHNQIIPGEAASAEQAGMSAHEVDIGLSEGRTMRTQHPNYHYEPTTISLGQGALSSIATALASFRKIKRILGREYPGGILLIDEIEAGLHPRAQNKLLDKLLSLGKELRLQIIVTTHSLVFLDSIYQRTIGKEAIDRIVYLMDTKKPCVKDLTIDEIREEMLLSKTAFERRKKSTVTIYTEDDEGLTVLRRIIRKTDLAEHEKTKGFSIRKVAISIGCNQMIKMAKNKDLWHFSRYSVCVFDADVEGKSIEILENCVRLPTEAGLKRSPEEEIFAFLQKAQRDVDGDTLARRKLSEASISWDWIEAHLNLMNIESVKQTKKRDAMKKWFRGINKERMNKIIDVWIDVNMDQVRKFAENYKRALQFVKAQYE